MTEIHANDFNIPSEQNYSEPMTPCGAYRSHGIFSTISALALFSLLPFCGFSLDSPASAVTSGCHVQGRVFEDRNRNGRAESQEKGIAGVIVSDGSEVTQTDSSGAYRLAGPVTKRFVFVIMPAGYRALERFYTAIPVQQAELTADFALVAAPETAQSVLTLAHITDIHVSDTPSAQAVADDLETINAWQPDLIMVTGDLVISGSQPEQWQNYLAAIRQSESPVFHVIGNHDIREVGVDTYQRYFGPTYYAFDYGRYHFVILSSVEKKEPQYAWLEKELSLQPKGKEILVFQHYPPDEKLMQFLAGYNTVAVFSGHWHSSKVMKYGKIASINTPPLRYGGIDTSAREFRLIRFTGGRMSICDQFPSCRELFTVVAPGPGAVVPRGSIQFQVKAYDVLSTGGPRVTYQLDAGERKEMKPVGKFCHVAEETIQQAGSHTLKVQALWDHGSVEKTVNFSVTEGRLAEPRVGRAWPMFRHDAARSGVAEDIVVPPLRLAWSQPLGATIHVSSPVVADGTVYIGLADEELGDQAGVCALDAVSGKIKWRYRTATSVKHTVAIYSNRVYGATVDGNIFALDAATGKMDWSFSLGNGLNSWVFAAPLVSDQVVYGGAVSAFVALDAVNGREIWRAKCGKHDWISSISSPALDRDKIFVGFNWGGGPFALDRATGKQIWQTKAVTTKPYASPVLSDNRLYCGMLSSPFLYIINTDDGSMIGSNRVDAMIATPLVGDRQIVCGTDNGEVRALDPKTGKELWRYKTGPSQLDFFPYKRDLAPVISSPALSGKVVYFGGTDGKLRALDLEDGRELWSYDLGCPITSSPALSGNALYISTYDGAVYAFASESSSP